MELQQLRLFLAAAESESFTRGAERAFVSQPALSASISKLEDEMGVKLFTRNKRSVVLTPAGRKLLKRAKVIVGECSRAKEELRQHDAEQVLRLGVINTLSVVRIAKLVEQFRRDNPDVLLQVFDVSAPEMERLERENRIDLALTLLLDPSRAGRRFTESETLFTEPYVVAMNYEHHLSQSKGLHFADLAAEPFISRSHCEHRRAVQGLLKEQNVRLNVSYMTDQDERALALVKAGVGISIIPKHYETVDIATSTLLDGEHSRAIGFEWGHSDNSEQIVRFIEFARTVRWD